MVYLFIVSNHPVHILSEDGKISPSSFIPFCEFGGDMSQVGKKIKQFESHVCNCFKAKILNDQLCYEVDLNRYSNRKNVKAELKLGFAFLLDYNFEKQGIKTQQIEDEEEGLVKISKSVTRPVNIFMNTLGIIIKNLY